MRGRLAVPRLLDHRVALVAAAAVALGAGLATGAARAGSPADDADALPASPEQCAAAQVAWAQSASSQVGMTADNPATLRTGFRGASEALAEAVPPPAVAADWDAVKDYVDTVAQAVDKVDAGDGDAITAAVGAALSTLDTTATTAASARVTAYLRGDCAD
ncbi:hypothetical protein EV386_3286 [Xylanimonas ulmi]|uniref:Uncharacterized protein n=1 Tax=Xylanimonas ulmi TaxID=228973 RepID=A0A4V2EYG7_9MICO|nr:hypothetical protein EV386_3286 [Xylanibacterium ulmi]